MYSTIPWFPMMALTERNPSKITVMALTIKDLLFPTRFVRYVLTAVLHNGAEYLLDTRCTVAHSMRKAPPPAILGPGY